MNNQTSHLTWIGKLLSEHNEAMTDNWRRKKAEQAEAREAIKQQKSENTAVGGDLGQRGGPANPVDKDNYPNSGVQG